jgi:hypothetical protein
VDFLRAIILGRVIESWPARGTTEIFFRETSTPKILTETHLAKERSENSDRTSRLGNASPKSVVDDDNNIIIVKKTFIKTSSRRSTTSPKGYQRTDIPPNKPFNEPNNREERWCC